MDYCKLFFNFFSKIAKKMSYIKLEITPFEYDSRYIVFIKEEGNEEVIKKIKTMFNDDNVENEFDDNPIVTKSNYQDFIDFKKNFKYTGKFDREELVLIEHEIKIDKKREDYSSNKKWAKAVFDTSFVKHLDWKKIFKAQVFNGKL